MTEHKITITVGVVEMTASLNDSPTATAIWDALPISEAASTWGDEIYFGISVDAVLDDDAQEVVDIGDLGYWPPGNAFCLFFGPTPMSQGDEIRPASAVNVVGQIHGDPAILKQVADGDNVVVTTA